MDFIQPPFCFPAGWISCFWLSHPTVGLAFLFLAKISGSATGFLGPLKKLLSDPYLFITITPLNTLFEPFKIFSYPLKLLKFFTPLKSCLKFFTPLQNFSKFFTPLKFAASWYPVEKWGNLWHTFLLEGYRSESPYTYISGHQGCWGTLQLLVASRSYRHQLPTRSQLRQCTQLWWM